MNKITFVRCLESNNREFKSIFCIVINHARGSGRPTLSTESLTAPKIPAEILMLTSQAEAHCHAYQE